MQSTLSFNDMESISSTDNLDTSVPKLTLKLPGTNSSPRPDTPDTVKKM